MNSTKDNHEFAKEYNILEENVQEYADIVIIFFSAGHKVVLRSWWIDIKSSFKQKHVCLRQHWEEWHNFLSKLGSNLLEHGMIICNPLKEWRYVPIPAIKQSRAFFLYTWSLLCPRVYHRIPASRAFIKRDQHTISDSCRFAELDLSYRHRQLRLIPKHQKFQFSWSRIEIIQ